jgi:DNA-binding NarL/FixJ family response regulator
VAVSGQAVDAAGRASDLTVRLIELPPDLARAARASLTADGVVVHGGAPTGADDVAVIGTPGAPAGNQRRAALVAAERLAPLRVVALTELERRSALQRLVATGIHGLVLVAEIERSLAVTVRAVAAGQVCVTEAVRAAIAPRPLSPRERQILAIVIMGLTNAEIAQRLHIEESTVKSHLASIFDKLGVRSRAEAAELVTDPEDTLGTGIVRLAGEPRRG